MSSTCTLLNSPSPPSPQQATTEDADLFNKCSPRSTAQFRQPSLTPGSKLKAVLARLTPPHLLRPVPKSSSRRLPSSSPSTSSASASSDRPSGFPAIHTSACADLRIPLAGATTTSADSFPLSLDVATDVEKLLHIFSEAPFSDNINKRTLALGALCALCVSSPTNANRCVGAGGVEIMIDTLNSTAQSSHPSPPGSAIVEESEKALLLLQLLTSSSEDGCIAALRHSSSIIATLGKKLLRVSESCTASVIAILTALCCRPDVALFRKSVSETAIPSKLVVVLQVASKDSTKRRAGRLLRLLATQHQYTTDQVRNGE